MGREDGTACRLVRATGQNGGRKDAMWLGAESIKSGVPPTRRRARRAKQMLEAAGAGRGPQIQVVSEVEGNAQRQRKRPGQWGPRHLHETCVTAVRMEERPKAR
ncbi:hypothetical protein NDU88_000635 [Pleurodeles waltl]|uniref:Uncharacterized protein n=1 Tax=Pleurodeles waltl TaxID=8319 RepID=A0AAV7NCR5_PLEWA|nr:hypothetical protein NDU88_000635 [Pleurodeles waltl]